MLGLLGTSIFLELVLRPIVPALSVYSLLTHLGRRGELFAEREARILRTLVLGRLLGCLRLHSFAQDCIIVLHHSWFLLYKKPLTYV